MKIHSNINRVYPFKSQKSLKVLVVLLLFALSRFYSAFSQGVHLSKKWSDYDYGIENKGLSVGAGSPASFKEEALSDEAYLELASVMKEKGAYNESIQYLKKYLKDRNNKEAQLMLGEVYYLNAQEDKALFTLRGLNVKGRNYEVYAYLGLTHETLGNIRSAIDCYTKSILLRENTVSLYRLGKIFYNEKHYQGAARIFKELIDYDASVRLAYYYLGSAYLNQSNFIQAYKYLLKASHFYPHNSLIAQRLSLVRKRLGRSYFIAESEKLLEKRKKIKLGSYKPVKGVPEVKVAVLEKAKEVSFKSSGEITLRDRNRSIKLERNKLYTLKGDSQGGILKEYRKHSIIAHLKCPLTLESESYPFYILGAVYGRSSFYRKAVDLPLRGSLKIIQDSGRLTVINILSVEEYLYGVLPAEVYPGTDFEAMKAQAVAARTLVIRNIALHKRQEYDLCSSVKYQVYKGMKELPLSNKAVDATRGEILVFNNEPIDALYHSNSGGCLRSDAFSKVSYLRNGIDDKDIEAFKYDPWSVENWFKNYPESFSSHTSIKSNFRWQRVYDNQDFSIIYGVPIGNLSDVSILKRGECAHIKSISVEIGLRKIVLAGDLKIRQFFDNLRSSAFIIEVKYIDKGGVMVPGFLLFWGSGFGHGEGMSQEGAQEMAKEGFNYKDILHHYYKNVSLIKSY